MKRVLSVFIFAAMLLTFADTVSAHVTLSPKEAVVGYTTFTVNVPTEKEIPTVAVRLVIPEGVEVHGVLPVAGWTHTEKKMEMDGNEKPDHEGDESSHHGKVTEIVWSGGKIADGEFMQFPISISYAGDPKQLVWKAYQTYSDGSIVAWDDTSEKNPAPKVSMVASTKIDQMMTDVSGMKKGNSMQTSWLSVGAFLLSVAALAMSMKKKE